MKVIGAGLPRTGTASLHKALQILGFGPCYHMAQAVMCEDEAGVHGDIWAEFARSEGAKPVPLAVYKNFKATVDFPSSAYYKEISQAFPEARIVLSVRKTPEDWVKSYQNLMATTSAVTRVSGRFKRTQNFLAIRDWLEQDYFNNKNTDAERKEAYLKHNQEVLDYFGEENVLVHSSEDGWKPLCEFLDVAVPNTAYPHSNSKLGLFGRLMKVATKKDVSLDEALG